MHQFRATRRMTRRDARLVAGSHRTEVTILNVSRTGLRLKGVPDDLPPDTLVRVQSGPVNLTGQITWVSDGYAGVRLAAALSGRDARFLGVTA